METREPEQSHRPETPYDQLFVLARHQVTPLPLTNFTQITKGSWAARKCRTGIRGLGLSWEERRPKLCYQYPPAHSLQCCLVGRWSLGSAISPRGMTPTCLPCSRLRPDPTCGGMATPVNSTQGSIAFPGPTQRPRPSLSDGGECTE